ncbi:GIY-YIG nuclease family protein [Candidatus Pelagibacter sp. HIMB1509]|uniref:GIY-YIG nuclease family protein n=1 Tax=Candidatus Pelagibacter sp. HIMB1509 TaxID=3413339 RepID=UPI003F8412EC
MKIKGNYIFKNKENLTLYVGTSNDCIGRINNHFFKDKNNFNKDMIKDTKYINIVISNINSENSTLEQSLFKRLKPIFNYRKNK